MPLWRFLRDVLLNPWLTIILVIAVLAWLYPHIPVVPPEDDPYNYNPRLVRSGVQGVPRWAQ